MPDGEAPVGRLIVIEGADGVGRSTLIALLREWLEGQGVAVAVAAAGETPLAAAGLAAARDSAGIDPATLTLLHAATLADALERQVLPALRAGLVVLVDRYVYTPIARGLVRGLDGDWLADVFAFAPPPDVALYLDADVSDLVPRVIARGGPGYRESGSDVLHGSDRWANFRVYQGLLLQEYREIAAALAFRTIDTRRGIGTTFLTAATVVARALSAPMRLPAAEQRPEDEPPAIPPANGQPHEPVHEPLTPPQAPALPPPAANGAAEPDEEQPPEALTPHPIPRPSFGRPQR
jgi:dTMP kinase